MRSPPPQARRQAGSAAKHLHASDVERLPEGKGWLMAEFGGDTREQATDRALRLISELARESSGPSIQLLASPEEQKRLRAPQRPMPLRTHFAFREDAGDFAHAALRCVGVGKCRRTETQGP